MFNKVREVPFVAFSLVFRDRFTFKVTQDCEYGQMRIISADKVLEPKWLLVILLLCPDLHEFGED